MPVARVRGMSERQLVIIGGGLAGLSAGCYALASGYRTTIVEHNLALGGVCTAWSRGPYVVDGCIHWLTGGAFARLYEELGIVPRVPLHTLERWVTWRDAQDGSVVDVTRDLLQLARDLRALGPEDGEEIDRLLDEAKRFADLSPGVDRPPELTPLRDQLHAFWEMRGSIGALAHFRKPIGVWSSERLQSAALRRFFAALMPEDAPALMLLMVFGYLERGWLSRPGGGSGAFRDALVDTYQRLGGRTTLHATVDEILTTDGRTRGVRLDDGSMLEADAVISTSSTPETVLRLLGGRYDAEKTRERLAHWRLFQPIVLASFGVAAPLADVPAMLLVDRLAPFTIGATDNERLYLRVCNDDPALAPPGHSVVQAMLGTDYDWWATRGTGYQAAKEEVAKVALEQIEHALPGIREQVRMTDVATPLTYWRLTRSWRGAYEGWRPSLESVFGHVHKKLAGLEGLYMAGQWVEPGGGVPTAVMSGRQAVQLVCADDRVPFQPNPSAATGVTRP
jgi:phytoene dehydrogenase-like protein